MLDWGAPAWFLAFFAFVPLAVLIARKVAAGIRTRKIFAPRRLWERMRLRGDEGETLARAAIVFIGMALLIVGLADPRNGAAIRRIESQDAPRLLIALDVSRSMWVEDTRYGSGMLGSGQRETRFEAARQLLEDVLSGLGGWNVGLLVFAGEPLVLCPVTSDHIAARTLLERARPGDPAIKAGSHIENALRSAAALLGNGRGSVLLVTDGEELSGSAVNAARHFASRKIPIYTVGLGSAQAAPIRLPSGETLAWRGATVLSARNDELLQRVALLTKGRYWAPTAVDVGMVQTPVGVQIAGGFNTPAGRRQPGPSRKAWPVAIGLAILSAEALWGTRRPLLRLLGQLLGLWLGSSRTNAGKRTAAALEPALRSASAGLLIAVVAGWTWPAIPYVQDGLSAYKRGDAKRSAKAFEEAAKRDDSPEVRYDLGNAYHLGGSYGRSLRAYREALEKLPPRSRLAEHAHYNSGNSHFLMGNYHSAISAYKKALEIDPKDEDALFNLALAQGRLASAQQNTKGGGRPVPGSPSEGAIPMPDADEAESLLSRLEADERQRQADSARHDGLPDPGAESPSQLARRLLKEAEQSVTRQLEKDW